MAIVFGNNASSKIAASLTGEVTDTTITLPNGIGATFPALSPGDFFYVTLADVSVGLEVDWEICKVTAVSNDQLTVERGQDNTVVRSWPIDTPIELRLTAAGAAFFMQGGPQGDKGDAFVYADFTPAEILSITGPESTVAGPTGADSVVPGPQGDAFVYADFTSSQLLGLKGDQGDTGTNLILSGSVAVYADLPTGVTAGSVYVVLSPNSGWLSDGSNGWTDIGPIQGPAGASGLASNGTVANNTLRWTGTAWAETDKLQIDSAGVVKVTNSAGDVLFPTAAGTLALTNDAAIVANTAKVGITPAQAAEIAANTAKTSSDLLPLDNTWAGNNTFTAGLESTGAGTNSFRAGTSAGSDNQGANSIAIGELAGETDQGANGIIINSTGAVLDDPIADHIHIASSTGSIDYTTANGWIATEGSSTFSLKLEANLPLLVYDGPGVPTTIGIQIGSTAGTVAAGDDGRFDTVDISALPAATALTGVELLSGLQDLDAVSMTTGQLNGSPVTTKRGFGLNALRGYSDFTKTIYPYSAGSNNQSWGQEPYYVKLAGTSSQVEQGASQGASNLFNSSARLRANGTNGLATIRSMQSGLVLLNPLIYGVPGFALDTQFTVAIPADLATSSQNYKIRIGFTSLLPAWELNPTDGMYFQYEGVTNPNWQAVVTNSSVNAAVDTGVQVTPVTVQTFRVFWNSVLNQTEFYIDGVQVVVMPDGSLTQSRAYVAIYVMEVSVFKTNGSSEREAYVFHHKYSIEKPPLEHY